MEIEDILKSMFKGYSFDFIIQDIEYGDDEFEFNIYINSIKNKLLSFLGTFLNDKQLNIYLVNDDSDYFFLGIYDIKNKIFHKSNNFWEEIYRHSLFFD